MPQAFLFFDQFEMPLADALDLREFLSRAAEPDMNILILHADFLREFRNFHPGITGCAKCAEDFLFEGAAAGAFYRTSRSFLCCRGRRNDFLGIGRTAATFF